VTFTDPGIVQLLLVWAVVVLASVLRAFTGFGFALAAVPIFSLFLAPTEAVVLSVLLTLALSLMSLRSYWGVVPLRPLFPLAAMTLVGTALGTAVLSVISVAQFQLWAGLAVVLACVALTYIKPVARRASPLVGAMTGMATGFMNGALAIPGPPLIIYAMLTEPEPRRSRAFLMTVLLATSVVALVSYGVAGFIELRSLVYFLLASPALVVGNWLGNHLFHRYGDALYRRIALVALLLIGAAITARALL
jgi:uncharacterized membrane protein YfcA